MTTTDEEAILRAGADEPAGEAADVPEPGNREPGTEEPGSEVAVPEVPQAPTALEQVALMPTVPGGDEIKHLAQLAVTFAASEIVPKPLRGKPNDVFLVLMTARDIGLVLTTALRECHVIDGRVTVSPKLKLALVRMRGLGRVFPAEDNDMNHSTWFAQRADDPTTTYRAMYTWHDAQIAGLVSRSCQPDDHSEPCVKNRKVYTFKDKCKENWANYPAQMLQWRCLPDRAEALTRDGWRTRDKLAIGDEILGFDRSRDLLRWTTVTEIHAYEAADVYRLESVGFAMTATAGHRWVTDHRRRPGDWSLRTTDKLDSGQHSILAAAVVEDEWSPIAPSDAARLGWVLTDGSIQWRGLSPTISIGQSKYVEEVRALFGDRSKETTDPESISTIRGRDYVTAPFTRWRMSAAASRTLLAQFGVATKQERLDHTPMMLDAAGRLAMFQAMNLANSTLMASGAWTFRSGHEEVVGCWMTLATLLGHRCGRPTFAKGCWTVSTHTSKRVSAKRLSITPAGTEPVWCPSTGLGTWVTRLDGQIMITGNSMGYLMDQAFGEVGTGLYSPDELGAISDDDGYIDIREVGAVGGLWDGSEPEQERPEGWVDPQAICPVDDQAQIRALIGTLPDPAIDDLREMWNKVDDDTGNPKLWPLTKLPNHQVKTALALVEMFRKRAGKGEWGPGWPKEVTIPEGDGGAAGAAGASDETVANGPASPSTEPTQEQLDRAPAAIERVAAMVLIDVEEALARLEIGPVGHEPDDRAALAHHYAMNGLPDS